MERPPVARATLLKLAAEPRVCASHLLMTNEALRASNLLHLKGNPGAPAHDGPERLLIKTLNGDASPRALLELQQRVAADDRIVLADGSLVRNDLCGLLQDADWLSRVLHVAKRASGRGRRSSRDVKRRPEHRPTEGISILFTHVR